MLTDDVLINESGDRMRVGLLKRASFDTPADIVPCEHNEFISFDRSWHKNDIDTHLFRDRSRPCQM
jgi:hypothetical protein